MQQVAPGVYVESFYPDVTVGVILTGQGVICIDSPMRPADARRWRAQIAGLTDEPIRYLVYTDAHRDRILGGQYLGGAVVTHAGTGETLANCGEAFRQQAADSLARHDPDAAAEISHEFRPVLPQITFLHQLTFYLGSKAVTLQHVSGPAAGSLWVMLPDQRVLFTGDTLTVERHPALAEADIDGWLALLHTLSEQAPAMTLVPGRGGLTAQAHDIKKLAAYLNAVRTRVRSLIRTQPASPDMTALAQEFLDRFPVPGEERERVLRRIKAGLEHVYDLYRQDKKRQRGS